MRNREMKSLHSLLGEFLQGFRNDPEKTEIFLKELWPEIVGPQLSQRTRPQSFRRGELKVAVTGERWKDELEPLAESLSETINQFWGMSLVRKIRFLVPPQLPSP